MDRSYPYSRRLKSRARLHKRMVAVAAAGLVGATALFMLTWKADPISAALTPQAQSLPASARGAGDAQPARLRRIYPYSVIPGGVSGQAELARVIRTDRVVATHYASFDVDKAHPVVVEKPRAVHVSYRKGGKVYWTARKVMLAEGETLLSDGRNEMRARCANRISDVPQFPVEAHQPAMEELDQPVEVEEGERYALGADGLPVSSDAGSGLPRQTGQRFPVRGGSGFLVAPAASTPAATLSASTSLASSTAPSIPLTTMALSGSSSSLGSRPRPSGNTPVTPPTSSAGSDGGSSSSGSPTPSGGTSSPAPTPEIPAPPATTPIPDASATAPAQTPPPTGGQNGSPIQEPSPLPDPLPDTPLPPVFTPDPLPPPGSGPGPLFPEPGKKPEPEPFIPKPGLTPPLETSTEEPEPPAGVPEPGSFWLAGIGLAALLVLRRRPRSLTRGW